MNEKKHKPVILYIGIGCGAVVLLCVLVAVILAILGARWVKQVKTDHEDPYARTEKVKQILGCEELPPGYNAMAGITVPFVMDIAVLSDQQPDSKGQIDGFDDRGFFYIKILSGGQTREQLKAYMEGRTDTLEGLGQTNVHMEEQEIIRRGALNLKGYPLLYVAQRGELVVENKRQQGLNTILYFDCPHDRKLRAGIWFGPDSDPDAPAEKADFQGSPADEEALVAFLGYFNPCPTAEQDLD